MAKSRKKRDPDLEIEVGSGNVFADLRYRDPEEALAKSELIWEITEIIRKRGLTQREAAKILGTEQPRISDLMRGRISGFSTDRLLHFLKALNCNIEIRVRRPRSSRSKSQMQVRIL